MKRALVLSGGGARGAYQYGVWKALRRLHIKINIVTGTSIGALNGFLIVQNDYKKGLEFWNNLSYSNIFDDSIKDNDTKFKIYKKYIASFVKDGGMNFDALEKNVEDCVNINKFYNSKIDYGLITFRLNTFTPTSLTKKEIDKGSLVDYLMASSACYPLFKTKKINCDTYIDGGYCDNLPINLALKMGADEIIAVDLSMIRKVKNDENITYISPNNKLGSFFLFSKEEAKRAIKLGYNDTLKKYNKLIGKQYTFHKYTLPYIKLFYGKKYINNINLIIKPTTKFGSLLRKTTYKSIDKNILISMEYLARVFNLDETIIYSPWKFNKEIRKCFNSLEDKSIDDVRSLINKIKIKDVFSIKMIIKKIYNLIDNKRINNLNAFTILFPKEFMAAVYLYTIMN